MLRAIFSRLLLVLFSVVFTLFMLEVFMRVGFDLLPPQIQGDIQSVRVVPWDDEPLVRAVPFKTDLGYQARIDPGFDDFPVRWMDARFTFDTVNLWEHPVGLRTSPEPRWPLDIAAFGDSFTFCWTAVEDCWVQRLESEYGWSTLNAGQPGTGPTGQLKLMREVGVPVEPKLVVWLRYANDSFDDYVLHWLREEAPPLRSAPAADPARELKGLERYSALLVLLNNVLNPVEPSNDYQHNELVEVRGRQMLLPTTEYANPVSMSYPAVRYGWKKNVESYSIGIKMMRQEVGASVVFVVIPTKEEAYAPYLGDLLGEEYLMQLAENHRTMLETCESRGWHCIDPLPAFREAIEAGETVYYARDFHLDASGNAIVARLVDAYIREQGLVGDGRQ